MGKIAVLDKNVSELIAAGEVIERPASIVKELLENSIDSGASSITVEIKRGGISYIRVTDNGCGISKDDMPIAFLRHATSKISKEDDLEKIMTLGFRGEALASIIAVSKVDLLSKVHDSLEGNKIGLNCDGILEFESAGCPNGTTIIVRDLFYNVPARLKFLKKDSAESSIISGIVDKIALSHPEISFRYIKDNKEFLYTPGDKKMSSVIYSVLGKDFFDNSIEIDYEINSIKVRGFTSSPQHLKSNRSIQYFFINKRYIKSKILSIALEESYKEVAQKNSHPISVINLEVSPNTVDINVHPSKMEVKFENEKLVFDAIYFAVKSAIKKYNNNFLSFNQDLDQKVSISRDTNFHLSNVGDNITEDLNFETKSFRKIISNRVDEESNYLNENFNSYQNSSQVSFETKPFENFQNSDLIKETKYINFEKIKSDNKDINQDTQNVNKFKDVKSEINKTFDFKNTENSFTSDIKINLIGELFKTYILIEFENEFFVIDKHAAHEKILHLKLKSDSNSIDGQMLIDPIHILLNKEEHLLAIKNINLFKKIGFDVDDFGGSTIVIRESPSSLENYDISVAFCEMLSSIKNMKKDITPTAIEERLNSIACRSAIKSNDQNTKEELLELALKVLKDENVRNCPHGRPVIIKYSKKDIEKMFGRIK